VSGEGLAEFKHDYSRALAEYLEDPGEPRLEQAYELGRAGIAHGLSILDIAASHHAALAAVPMHDQPEQEVKMRVDAAGGFLLECLSTFEMTQRGFQEAQETARLEREHSRALRGLSDAALAITTARDTTELVELVTEHARTLVGAGRAHLLLTPPQDVDSRIPGEELPTSPEADSLLSDPELLSQALASQGATRLSKSDLERGRYVPNDVHIPEGWLVAPLASRDGRRLGVIELVDKRGGPFDEDDEAVVIQLAQMVSVALENAFLYQREHRIARTLQQSLLPETLPHIAEIELAARFHAAGDGYDVGGDFYDVFEVEDGWMVVIGDVCGKGPQAAAITALVRYTIRAAALREQRPTRILAVVNEAVCSQVGNSQFCTVACGLLSRDGADISIRLALAGHLQPFVRRRDGVLRKFGRYGTGLGIVEEPRFEEEHAVLHPGDMVIFYTDGLTESPHTRRWTASDFESFLNTGTAPGAAAVAHSLANEVVGPDRPRPRDDVAILVLAVQEPSRG
jgi:serine phosphatase RsbU (regulator of sigma subunit)